MTLLKSTRFSDATPFVGGGVKYTLEKRPFTEISPNASMIEQGLSEMTTHKYKGSDDLVWFAKKKMLVFGEDAIVTDIASVIDGAADSLEKSEAYGTAKKKFRKRSPTSRSFFDSA